MGLVREIHEIPLRQGASEVLTELLNDAYDSRVAVVQQAQYTTYVDTMGHAAQPMLVVIVTKVAPEPTEPEGTALPLILGG